MLAVCCTTKRLTIMSNNEISQIETEAYLPCSMQLVVLQQNSSGAHA